MVVSGQFLDSFQSHRHSVLSTRCQANHCPFWFFLLIIFFYFYAGDSLICPRCFLLPVTTSLKKSQRKTSHRHARKLHRAHQTQVDRRHLRALVTAAVLDHFSHRIERADLELRKVVAYGIPAVLEVKEIAVLQVVEVAQRLLHIISLLGDSIDAILNYLTSQGNYFGKIHFSLGSALNSKRKHYICISIMIGGLRRMITFEF